jgi:hypothetical protein
MENKESEFGAAGIIPQKNSRRLHPHGPGAASGRYRTIASAKEADMNFDHLGPSAIFWGAILLMCFFTSFFSYLERRSRYRTIEKMVEKGQTVPPEMFSRSALPYDRRVWHYQHPVASGIFLMCIGVAIAIFFWAMQGGGNLIIDGRMNNWLPVIGIFPFMVGLARLLSAGFERRPPNSGS